MACRIKRRKSTNTAADANQLQNEQPITKGGTVINTEKKKTENMIFGVDTRIGAEDLLQNNLTEYEWVEKNKISPSFWGRNIVGENCLTKEEINFLHRHGCKVAAIYSDRCEKQTLAQGRDLADKAAHRALRLGVPEGSAIFLEIDETEDLDQIFLRGYASGLISKGYTPAFMANTDAHFDFDRQFCRAMSRDKELMDKCLIWATAPILEEYDRVTTTHLVHPDYWSPFAPSGITRRDIAVWQYGKECHPIFDDNDEETSFNVNLIKDDKTIIEKMF